MIEEKIEAPQVENVMSRQFRKNRRKFEPGLSRLRVLTAGQKVLICISDAALRLWSQNPLFIRLLAPIG
jgi:ribosomal protein L28